MLIEGIDYIIKELNNGFSLTVGIGSCAGYGAISHKSWKRKNNPIGKILRGMI